ncbi:MAG: tetratricopeptide repeat protein [Planctomycetes bacterium]|nr:tetratricopeptide repeat protein [Planctomycetota bacterium]
MIKIVIIYVKTILIICSIISYSFADTAFEFNETGVRYMDSRDYDSAVESFEVAYAHNPESDTIKKNLIHSYMALAKRNAEQNYWGAAINTTMKAYELDSNNSGIQYNLSVFYSNFACEQMRQGLSVSALDNLKEALQYDKNNWVAYVYLGRLMYDQGDIKESVRYWTEAVSLNPELDEIKKRLERLENEIDIGEKFNSKQFMYFDVKYEGYERNNLAWKVVQILREAYTQLGHDFKYYPQRKIPVIIYTKEQFQQATGTQDWIGGLYDGIIRVTASTIEGKTSQFKNTLYHEYTHALLHQKTGRNLPPWLNEGLAQIMEPDSNINRRDEITILKNCLRNGNFIALSDLNNALLDRDNRERLKLAYLEAKNLIEYINKRYYFYRIVFILDELIAGKNIEEALEETIFMDTKALESGWLQWLHSN